MAFNFLCVRRTWRHPKRKNYEKKCHRDFVTCYSCILLLCFTLRQENHFILYWNKKASHTKLFRQNRFGRRFEIHETYLTYSIWFFSPFIFGWRIWMWSVLSWLLYWKENLFRFHWIYHWNWKRWFIVDIEYGLFIYNHRNSRELNFLISFQTNQSTLFDSKNINLNFFSVLFRTQRVQCFR